MQRRVFILAGGALVAAVALRLAISQQDRALELRRVLLLASGTPDDMKGGITRLSKALEEFGWVSGKNLDFGLQYANGDAALYAGMVQQAALAPPAVILTYNLEIAGLLRAATPNTPIVISSAADPVALGFVKSFSRPGGNITGVSTQSDLIARKRLALLHEALPNVTTIGYVFSNPATIAPDMVEFEKVAKPMGLTLQPVQITQISELEQQLDGLGPAGTVALFIFATTITYAARAEIAAIAVRHGLPIMGESKRFAIDGALMAYSADQSSTEQDMADLTDKILRGTKPGDLAFRQPMNFNLTVNLKTADALGLSLATGFLARADEIYE